MKPHQRADRRLEASDFLHPVSWSNWCHFLASKRGGWLEWYYLQTFGMYRYQGFLFCTNIQWSTVFCYEFIIYYLISDWSRSIPFIWPKNVNLKTREASCLVNEPRNCLLSNIDLFHKQTILVFFQWLIIFGHSQVPHVFNESEKNTWHLYPGNASVIFANGVTWPTGLLTEIGQMALKLKRLGVDGKLRICEEPNDKDLRSSHLKCGLLRETL